MDIDLPMLYAIVVILILTALPALLKGVFR